MDAGHLARAVSCQRAKHGNCAAILTFQQQPLGGFAPPRVWMLERPRELGRRHPAQIDRRAVPFPAAGSHPIDPAALLAGFEVEQRAALLRHVLRMVDDSAVHVDDVEGTVGSVGGEHRPEPGVARRQEVVAGARRLRGERHTVRRSHLPLYQVLRRLADEEAVAMLGRQRVSPMNVDTARCGERPRVRRAHQAGNE
jgi:hypothetical protein